VAFRFKVAHPRAAARNLFLTVVIASAFFPRLSRASEICHIHPPGIDAKEAEARVIGWFESLEDCETANRKSFGGVGTCHCFPDGIFKRPFDDRRFSPGDFRAPKDSLID
jgi:hypothetical protein